MLRATLQNALDNMADAQRAMRRKMRMYPALLGAKLHRRNDDPSAERRRWQDAQENAIISIHGQDISSEDQIEDAPQQPAGKREKAA